MSRVYKALMVDAGPDAGAEARIQLAAGLAGDFGAHLIGLAACPVHPSFGPPFGESLLVAEIIEDEVQRIRAMLQAAGDRFRTIAGATAEWRCFLEQASDAMAREARAADLIITGRLAEPGDVVMRAGRPVLVVAPSIAKLEGRRILVAWKESREARRAVIDALPLLTRAERVIVLEACEAGEDSMLAQRHVKDVAGLLLRHGASALGEVVICSERSAAAELLRAAVRLEADLVVAGGYGHTRLRERVFGGVTRELLATCPVCCLLSH